MATIVGKHCEVCSQGDGHMTDVGHVRYVDLGAF